ncbi:MAG: sulfurtransferase [Alphaproteobacteria bacterium]|nr:sulfurtransferase [Alphaproteobacteria bacterium]
MARSKSSIAIADLAARIGTDRALVVLDVRREAAFASAERVIATAAWRDHGRVAEWAHQLPAGAEIVVYCVHGHQVSQSAAARLQALGFAARYLDGGIEGFAAAGGATVLKATLQEAGHAAGPWVTREAPKIDRIACPWLIRRFVDSSAEFLFVAADGVAADTGHPELAPQAAGLLAVSLGLSVLYPDDREMLEKGMLVYDSLLAWCRHARAEAHGWPPAPNPVAGR